MNVDWPRWIKASVVHHFSLVLDNYKLVVDGERRPSNQINDRFELRFNGPDVSQKTRGEYTLGYTVNLLIISASNESDIYQLERMKGMGASAFDVSIPVYKYGTGANDDQSLLGCLTLKSDLDIRDFGYTGDTVYHVSINAYYLFESFESSSVYQEDLTFDLIVEVAS